MDKFMTLLVRSAELRIGEFREQYLDGPAQLVLRGQPNVRRLVASFADVTAAEAALDASTPPPAYDAVIEIWYDGPSLDPPAAIWESAEARGQVRATGARLVEAAYTYHVREVVQKEYERTWQTGTRSPGIKRVVPVTRAVGLDAEQFAAHWHQRHGPLALKHHVGMWKYVQNVVLSTMAKDAPVFDGIAELQFPTAIDLRERSIDSPAGAAVISADVSRFVGQSVSLFCSEYVLKDSLIPCV